MPSVLKQEGILIADSQALKGQREHGSSLILKPQALAAPGLGTGEYSSSVLQS